MFSVGNLNLAHSIQLQYMYHLFARIIITQALFKQIYLNKIFKKSEIQRPDDLFEVLLKSFDGVFSCFHVIAPKRQYLSCTPLFLPGHVPVIRVQ